MKWNNPGHEYDITYENIKKKKEFFLFGAGDYGNQFFNVIKNEVELIGYIDNNSAKIGTKKNGLMIYGFDQVQLSEERGIILTMSQIARIEPVVQLKGAGLKQDENYFLLEEFLSVYYMYKYGKVYMSTISFLPSTVCNLNCRYCLNFNPFAKEFYSRDMEELKADVDLFFEKVDRIMLFHISGGEPLLYKYTPDIIEYISINYGDRIDTLRSVTNGTVTPTNEVLQRLSRCDVEFTIDDYRDAVPQYKDNLELLTSKFNEFGIKYYINKADAWIDLAPETTDYSNLSEMQLIRHRDCCTQSWEELRGGKLFSCNYAAYAKVAGITREEEEECFDLTECISDEDKKRLVEFRLGYTKRGYTNFCKKCRGFKINNNIEVEPAVQVEKKY